MHGIAFTSIVEDDVDDETIAVGRRIYGLGSPVTTEKGIGRLGIGP